MEIDYGEVMCFDHIDCMPGSRINTTGKTMLSIDFRLALAEEYFEEHGLNVKGCQWEDKNK